jgi:hypothetical protein
MDAIRLPGLGCCLSLLIIAFLIDIYSKKEMVYQRNPVFLAYGIFFITQIISVFKAVNPWDAFIPLTFQFFLLILLFTGLTRHISRSFLLNAGLPLLILVGVVVSGVGILQEWGVIFKKSKPVSTFGNVNYAGVYIAAFIPLCLYLIFSKRSSVVSFGYLLCFMVLFYFLFRTGSKAAVVGAFSGILLGLVILLLKTRLLKFAKIAGIIFLTIMIVGLPVFIVKSRYFPEAERSKQVRFGIWKGCINLWLSEPVLGVGVGNFQERYQQFRDRNEFLFHNKPKEKPPFDVREVESAHNMYLQVLVETGIIGFLSFLYFLYVIFRRFIFFVKVAPEGRHVSLMAGLMGGVFSLMVCGFFNSFNTSIQHLISLMILLIFCEQLLNPKTIFAKRFVTENVLVIVFCMAIFLGFLTFRTGMWALSDHYYFMAVYSHAWGDYNKAENFAKRSLEINYYSWQTHLISGKVNTAKGRIMDAKHNYQMCLKLHPTNMIAMNNLGIIFAKNGEFSRAERLFLKAIKTTPFFFLSYHNLGKLYQSQKKLNKAKECFQKALSFNPLHASSKKALKTQ